MMTLATTARAKRPPRVAGALLPWISAVLHGGTPTAIDGRLSAVCL
jgi:hypothetical protein